MLVSQRKTKGKKRPMSQHSSQAEELFSLGLLVLCWSSSNRTRRTGRAICSTQSMDSRELALGRQAAGGHWTLLDLNPWGHPHSRPDSPWKNLPEREHAQHRRARSWRALVTAFPAGSHQQNQVRCRETVEVAPPRSPRGRAGAGTEVCLTQIYTVYPAGCSRPLPQPAQLPPLQPGPQPLTWATQTAGGARGPRSRGEVCQTRLPGRGGQTCGGQQGWANHGGRGSQGQGSLICYERGCPRFPHGKAGGLSHLGLRTAPILIITNPTNH